MPRKRWNPNQPDDDLSEKFVKIRSKPSRQKPLSELRERFESDESDWEERLSQRQGFVARVVEVHKRYVFVSPEPRLRQILTHDVWLTTIAKRFLQAKRDERNLVCVGDRVLCFADMAANASDTKSGEDLPRAVIEARGPRTTEIARLDPGGRARRHLIATNMDQILIVASYVNPKVSWGLLNRYLVLAEWERIRPIIVLNKRDLLSPVNAPRFYERCEQRTADLRKLGYTVLETHANASSAKKDRSLLELKKILQDKITLLSGHSGVGKSSLINQFDPELVQIVEPDEDIFYKGRHTTTFASLIKLGTGGYVMDTPGIRSFELFPMSAIDLSHCFVELRPFIGKCRYRECSHLNEPGCIVAEELEAGRIAEWRFKSYEALLTGSSGREGLLDEDTEDDYLEEPS